MTTWDTAVIRDLMMKASKIALRHYESPEISLKGDKTIVTQADREIETLLAGYFDRSEEGSYLIGEETVERRDETYIREAFSSTAWIVDPIDGTVPYAHHLPTWGISIGMMSRGTITNGAVYLPVTGELFMTDGHALLYGVSAGGGIPDLRPLSVLRTPVSGAGIFSVTQGMARSGSMGLANPVLAFCCAVVPMTYLTLGRIMAYIGSLKLWDIAGALALLKAADFVVRFVDGEDLTLEVNESMYRLEENDPKRWYTRNHIVCAPSVEVYDYLVRGITSLS